MTQNMNVTSGRDLVYGQVAFFFFYPILDTRYDVTATPNGTF